VLARRALMSLHHYQVLLEWDVEAAVWVTYVPAFNALSTFGETREEALANTREAILGYVEAAEKEGLPVSLPLEVV
jgi:predicted RNase H-like HicB family nuclease